MKIPFRVGSLRVYRDIVRLLWRHGNQEWIRQAQLEQVLQSAGEPPAGDAESLARDLEAMGPTFIKIGQLLSTRSDLLPPAHLRALGRLRDKVEPIAFEQVRQVVEAELGASLRALFRDFDEAPLATGSVAQVHRATLKSGQQVVVKAQRPGIREQIADDFAAMEDLARMLQGHTDVGRRYELTRLVTTFRRLIVGELDFRREAANLQRLEEAIRNFPNLVVPAPVESHTTARVLTMDFISGQSVAHLEPGRLEGLDGAALADELAHAFLYQFLIDGTFHADPHPGNVFLTDDGRVALLDLGMVAHVPPRMAEHFVNLLLAITGGRGEEAAERALQIGERRADFNQSGFVQAVSELVAEQYDRDLASGNFGNLILRMGREAANTGVRIPHTVMTIGAVIIKLEAVGLSLDRSYNPDASIRRHLPQVLRQMLAGAVEPHRMIAQVVDYKELIERFPARLNNLLDAAANNGLRFKVDALDEQQLTAGFQKVANRIASGLVLAALIIGAALMMNVQTQWTIFGFPGFAVLMFLLAAGLGLTMVGRIFWQDLNPKKGPRERK